MTLFIVLLLIFGGEWGGFLCIYLLFMNCNEMWETTE